MTESWPGHAAARAPEQGGSTSQRPDPRHVDPGAVLASLGIVAFNWDLGSGAMSFAGDVLKVLPGDWGHAFESVALLEQSQISPVPGARHAALFGEERLDGGSGVPYTLSYRLRS